MRRPLFLFKRRLLRPDPLPSLQSKRNTLNIRLHIQRQCAQAITHLTPLPKHLGAVPAVSIPSDNYGDNLAAPGMLRACAVCAQEIAHDGGRVLLVEAGARKME